MIYSTVLLPCLRVAFIGTLLFFFITWFSKRIMSLICSWRKSYEPKDEGNNKQKETEYSIKQDAWKQIIQEKYLEKTAKYKEDILIPREREKRARTEKEFYKHFGPLWSGEGSLLGGEGATSDDDNDNGIPHTNENRQAARRRTLPESEIPATIKCTKTVNKTKRIIELPEEPDELDPEAVLITMRTPISTIVRRRFRLHHSFQNVLDLMTKSGFGQHLYQLYTSFPRQVVSPNPEVPLSDLGFGKRVTLNIEHKTDDE